MRVVEGTLPFLEEKEHRIALVGAGGKTTLMYALAEEYTKRGIRVLVTTTTHIYQPQKRIWARSAEEAERLWKAGQYAVVGEEAENGKLKALTEAELREYMQIAQVVLVEADGAKGKPCKVPADFEPVIPDECDIVIGVMGMDALFRTVVEACFREKEAEIHFHLKPERVLTEEVLAEILASEEGTRKNVGGREYFVVLNKCDDEERLRSGRKILKMLKAKRVYQGILTSFYAEHILGRERAEIWNRS